MRTIGIIGSDGFLGWHLRCLLSTQEDICVKCCSKLDFYSDDFMSSFLRSCDVIIHVAGVNRGNDDELDLNTTIAKQLIEALKKEGVSPHLLYASTTHVDRGTVYGETKRIAGELFLDWSSCASAKFTNVVLPNLFGECGRPFYNSVVATFCYQLANNKQPNIENDCELSLLHANEAANIFLQAIYSEQTGDIKPEGYKITVSGLLCLLQHLHDIYSNGIVPNLEKLFVLRMFNTYRSFLYPDRYPAVIELHEDDRGALYEGVKTKNGGQAFLSTTKPGVIRGNHFHLEKFERFLVVRGKAKIALRKMFSSEVVEFHVSGNSPCYVDIPTLYTHNITNTGDENLLTLFWSHEIFNPNKQDTYLEPVEPGIKPQ